MTNQQKNIGIKSAEKTIFIEKVMEILARTVEGWAAAPYVTECARAEPDPFKILISTILSLRTRDLPTQRATEALFTLARTPEEMMRLSVEQIADAIKPAMYYQVKVKTIHELSRRLVEEYGGRVPDEIEELLKFKGVGRKTANLVVTLGFGKPGICVDTHVHRICNRLWAIQTRDPEETEVWLREHLSAKYWIPINSWMVVFGQRVCQPISPWCSKCPLRPYCRRWGVTRSR